CLVSVGARPLSGWARWPTIRCLWLCSCRCCWSRSALTTSHTCGTSLLRLRLRLEALRTGHRGGLSSLLRHRRSRRNGGQGFSQTSEVEIHLAQLLLALLQSLFASSLKSPRSQRLHPIDTPSLWRLLFTSSQLQPQSCCILPPLRFLRLRLEPFHEPTIRQAMQGVESFHNPRRGERRGCRRRERRGGAGIQSVSMCVHVCVWMCAWSVM
ncbi:hypothetical protein V8E36_000818, partial [Tilletia maclaganii]